jgi:hypothetical protein
MPHAASSLCVNGLGSGAGTSFNLGGQTELLVIRVRVQPLTNIPRLGI